MTLFSIVTVVKNNPIGLEKTILSVLEQNFKNFEFIVIGGESTDNTNIIIQRYKKYLKKFIIEKDAGIYFAMNKGLSYCNGEYINFLNSGDTYCSTTTLNKVSAASLITKRTDDAAESEGATSLPELSTTFV